MFCSLMVCTLDIQSKESNSNRTEKFGRQCDVISSKPFVFLQERLLLYKWLASVSLLL